jgi:hypothetical protein
MLSFILNGGFTAALIDATGEMVAYPGRVWFAERTGTKDIHKVGFRFGTVVKAGGSGLTVSLQNLATAAGPPGVPDETQDQTVAIANADAGFVSNVWYQTGALSADRTVTYGDSLAIVVEYDGGGRLSSDAVNLATLGASFTSQFNLPVLKTGGTWASIGVNGNCILEFSDGSFGSLEGDWPVSAQNTHTYKSDSAADEFAMAFTFPMAVKIDGLRLITAVAGNTSDFEVVLYSGTSALQTVSVDANQLGGTTQRWCEVPIPETEIAANTTHYLSCKPTTTNTVSVYSTDVAAAGHLIAYPGGTSFTYSTRVDAGSWAAVTTTRRLCGAVRVSSVSDGAGSGGMLVHPGLGGRLV